jgi:hypothetical protein
MNQHHYHAVVWIDHHEARVFHFSPTDVERLVLHPDHPIRHIHHKANSIGSGHASESHDYLHAVAESIADAGAVLITGPANAKTELVNVSRIADLLEDTQARRKRIENDSGASELASVDAQVFPKLDFTRACPQGRKS